MVKKILILVVIAAVIVGIVKYLQQDKELEA